MLDDVSNLSRAVTADVAGRSSEAATVRDLLAAWQDRNRRALDRGKQVFAELAPVPTPDAAMLSVALRELRALA